MATGRIGLVSTIAMAAALAGCASGARERPTLAAAGGAAEALPPLPDAIPLDEQGSGRALAEAPPVEALPPGPPLHLARPAQGADYAWIDRAEALSEAIGAAPPDYAFSHGDVEAWAWTTGSGYVMVAEPVADGFRYYYFEPHEEGPFLVRDPYYSYGYRNGRLTVVYESPGTLLAAPYAASRIDAARRYHARGLALHPARIERERRAAVEARLWAEHVARIEAERRAWEEARLRDVEWLAWQARIEAIETRRLLERERWRRRVEAERFRRWREAHRPPPRHWGGPGPAVGESNSPAPVAGGGASPVRPNRPERGPRPVPRQEAAGGAPGPQPPGVEAPVGAPPATIIALDEPEPRRDAAQSRRRHVDSEYAREARRQNGDRTRPQVHTERRLLEGDVEREQPAEVAETERPVQDAALAEAEAVRRRALEAEAEVQRAALVEEQQRQHEERELRAEAEAEARVAAEAEAQRAALVEEQRRQHAERERRAQAEAEARVAAEAEAQRAALAEEQHRQHAERERRAQAEAEARVAAEAEAQRAALIEEQRRQHAERERRAEAEAEARVAAEHAAAERTAAEQRRRRASQVAEEELRPDADDANPL